LNEGKCDNTTTHTTNKPKINEQPTISPHQQDIRQDGQHYQHYQHHQHYNQLHQLQPRVIIDLFNKTTSDDDVLNQLIAPSIP
jgi:hypothetical protein